MGGDLSSAITATAGRLGIEPADLATAISYETGGTFNPDLYGGSGGRHLGLIQFGPSEQERYGVKPGMGADAQMGAVENYLRDRGVKPGMGLLDVYSAINAGRPGLYDRSDAANGGAPGTVADKVASMYPHRLKAQALLGGGALPQTNALPPQTAANTASPVPFSFNPGAASAEASAASPDPYGLAALAQIPAAAGQQNEFANAPPLQMAVPAARLARARAMARAMNLARLA